MRKNIKLSIVSKLILTVLIFGTIDLAYSGEAILSWVPPTTNVDGTPLTDLSGYKVYYGTTTGSYNSTVDVGNTATTNLINLKENATYYFAVTAYDTTGNESSYSNEVSKAIPDLTPPVISGVTINNVTSTSADITWTTDEAATSQIEYGTSTGYGLSTTLDTNLITSHSVLINSLSSSTTYHYRVKSTDMAGNIIISSDYTFTTATSSGTTALVISGVTISNITTTDALVTWTTDGASTSQIEYGTTSLYGTTSKLDNNLILSHTLILSGLTPNTSYKLRVLSVDQAGNQAVSQGYSLTTLGTMQADIPAQITDLMVRPGSSTKNSLTLDWTATGSDGTVGTATSYDLRMSIYKIIEDGITPIQGEINFSSAQKVSGLSVPATAGSSESIVITQLENNSVYFFAIEAIDEKGNISPISNVINGNNVPPLPVTALRNGFTMISLPLTPQTSDVQTLLGGITGSPVELFWWRANSTAIGSGSFIAETNIVPGYGYLLKSNTDNAVLNISGTVITDPSRAIPLQPGWNMIGNPYTQDTELINTYIRNIDTGELKSYEDAVIAGWVSNALYIYNGLTYSFVMYNKAALKIWQGYWIAVLKAGQYEMIIYKP